MFGNERDNNIEHLRNEINNLSYLRDETALKDYISNRKKELMEEIIKIKNSSIEEISADRGIYSLEKIEKAKERYDGVTLEELEEYVDLLVQKEIIESQFYLRRLEIQLDDLTKHLFKTNSNYDFDPNFSINGIEELDLEQKEIKEVRRKSLVNFAKLVSVIGVASLGMTIVTSLLLGVDALTTAILALEAPAVIVGLCVALGSTAILVGALRNKNVVKKLKEQGLYDLALKAVDAEKQIESFEEEKGMVGIKI